ncbi:MAG: response regulator, partial [Zoogloea sp.]|nr:response regulator [Zoogloea sp.]
PRAMLERSGVTVFEAEDATAALAVLEATQIDCILLDISMPGIAGDELCRMLRADARFSGLRIVAYTAHALASECRQFIEAGFDEVLVKPVRLDGVLKAVGLG